MVVRVRRPMRGAVKCIFAVVVGFVFWGGLCFVREFVF